MDEKKITFVFTKQAESALFEIEKEYNLEEKDEECIKKIKENKPLNIKIVSDLIRGFAKTNINKENFINSLQKKLNIGKDIAENIFNDVLKNIIPFMKKLPSEGTKGDVVPENIDYNQSSKIDQGEKKIINNIYKQKNEIKSSDRNAVLPTKIKKSDIPSKKLREIKKLSPNPLQRKSDKYREQI